MSQPFLSEIRMFGFNFPPRGWAQCDGQLLQINQNQALFALVGTTYGGNGQTNFALPDLRGSTPVHFGNGGGWNPALGERGGTEAVTLTAAQIPPHTHALQGSATEAAAGNPGKTPTNQVLATARVNPAYAPVGNGTTLAPGSIGNTGGAAHENMQPYLTILFCIALQGVFPSRN